ncbi:MAG: hypothetical protein WKH64_12190 [Chloroflexia bacterium]
MLDRVSRLEAIERHGVALNVAALQFAAAHPAVSALVRRRLAAGGRGEHRRSLDTHPRSALGRPEARATHRFKRADADQELAERAGVGLNIECDPV